MSGAIVKSIEKPLAFKEGEGSSEIKDPLLKGPGGTIPPSSLKFGPVFEKGAGPGDPRIKAFAAKAHVPPAAKLHGKSSVPEESFSPDPLLKEALDALQNLFGDDLPRNETIPPRAAGLGGAMVDLIGGALSFLGRVSVPSHPVGESVGKPALQFLADRGGVGLMAQNAESVALFFRNEFGDQKFNKLSFLFEDNDISRARIQQLRTRIAEKVGHRYEDLEAVRSVVVAVLKEEGIDLSSWLAESRGRHQKDGDANGVKTLESMQKDVMEGVLLIQLLPDEVPLFRSTGANHAGQAGENGSSWWGVGESGLAVAVDYASGGRLLMKTTMGQLRQNGVVRSDEMAVTGNAIELYHRPVDGKGQEWSPYTYEDYRPTGLAFSLDRLNAKQKGEVQACLAGSDPQTLSIGDRKKIVQKLFNESGWTKPDIEKLVGVEWTRIFLGYNQKLNIDLPFLSLGSFSL